MLDIPFENLDISFSGLIEDFSLSKHSNLLAKGLISSLTIYILSFVSFLAIQLSVMKFSNRSKTQDE
jgi:hypothetical protein